MKQKTIVNFYATAEDLRPGVRKIEGSRRLQYVRCGLFDSPALTVYGSLLEVEDLCRLAQPDHLSAPLLLIANAFARIDVREVPQRRGGTKYAVDQLANPGSIVIRTGGVFGDGYLLPGQIGTVAADDPAVELFRDFSRVVTKGFRMIRGYAVGPEAVQLMRGGVRLTTDARANPDYDLKD